MKNLLNYPRRFWNWLKRTTLRFKRWIVGLFVITTAVAATIVLQPDPLPPLPPPEVSVARPDLAVWNSNSVENPDGSITSDFRLKWVNYLAADGWKTIVPEFRETVGGVVVDKAPFTAVAPLRSTGEAVFISNNRWDVFDKKEIDTPPVVERIIAQGVGDVPGVITNGDLGFGETQYVLYSGAYPAINADLIYWVHQGAAPRLSKLVRFNSAPVADVQLPFLISIDAEQNARVDFRWTKSGEKMRWDERTNLRIERGLSFIN